ncbi:MAG: hypothetical protein IJ724_10670 [Muribaculaceae bacterium]|nr:hypothetical protein [Muribaculaceae bacterium]MBR1727086.1 hypothetical protein [Muribaculaceae bacterium]
MEKKVLIKNFWPKTEWDDSTELTEDQLGWEKGMTVAPGSNDPKDIFDYWIKYWGFDLGLYYVEDDVFLFFEMDYKEAFILPPDSKWDGKYIFERSELHEQSTIDLEPIFKFTDTDMLWNEFRYKGKNLKYLIEHSVVTTSH